MSILVFTVGTIVLADSTRVPVETKEPPLVINTKVVEGHYLITGPKYKSTAQITQPPGTQVYLVYQYTGGTVTKGIGFMSNGYFVIGWEQEKALGVTSIKFKNGKGIAKWASNPGNGRIDQETWSLIDDEN